MTSATRTMRFVLVFVVLGTILGAVIGIIREEGIGGIVIEAVTGGLMAGVVTLATSSGSDGRGRGVAD